MVSRIISSGDDLPVTGTYASGNAPAIASDGSIVARITGNFGGGKLGAIFTKSGAGAAALPAVQGGDMLGTQKVRSFTVLKPVSRAPSAARSVNATGSVAALVKFTDGKQALVKVTLP